MAVTALLVSGCGGPAGPAAPASAGATPAAPLPAASLSPPPAVPGSLQARTGPYSKVLVIAEENKTYDQVMKPGRAPYLQKLAARYASAQAMDAGYPARCPSLAAYLLMTSGTRAGICDDGNPAEHRLAGPNIFSQVADSGRQWRGYVESMPGPCRLTNSGRYLVRHAPAPYYASERTRCRKWDLPMGTTAAGALHDDLAAGTLPAYAFVTPNACNDMHGAPGCGPDQVATGDAWLARWMPKILSGPDYRAGRLVVIVTWDEGSRSDNHIATLVIAPTAQRLSVRTRLTHCSMLRLTEETLGLPLLGCAADGPSPRAAFHLN
jgi:phosphatidylinositol-3-phosphatase